LRTREAAFEDVACINFPSPRGKRTENTFYRGHVLIACITFPSRRGKRTELRCRHPIHTYACIYVYMYVCIYVYACVCVCVCVCVSVCVCSGVKGEGRHVGALKHADANAVGACFFVLFLLFLPPGDYRRAGAWRRQRN
jgi:hypothetical protein